MSTRKDRALRVVHNTQDVQSTVHLGQVLRGHRERAKLTQEQAAVRAGITRGPCRTGEETIPGSSPEYVAGPDAHLSLGIARGIAGALSFRSARRHVACPGLARRQAFSA